MKKLILLALVITMGMNCRAQETSERYTTSSPLIENTKKYLAAYENQDWDTWMMQYTDSSKIYHNTWENARMPEEALKSHKELLSNMTSYEFLDEPIFYEQIVDDEGKTWVYMWGIWKGTLKGSGETIKVPVHLALWFKDGKNVEEYGFYDTSSLMAAIQKNQN
ncbi:nuclear transport factor 2 family protein [Salegentibacter chungangensis]|uniref:Nuclear transport factor 2 family protein n=1 Tax=Salegentibacter chungangensis TaxID=1335724 RepID=A0ABW3NMQ0_9FLAO